MNFLRNYRFREEYAEQITDDNFDDIQSIPKFVVLSSIMNRLDSYIGIATTFKELDFGPDFLEYLPNDVVVIEDVHEDGSRTTIQPPPQDQPVAAMHPAVVSLTPVVPVNLPKPLKEKSTTKKLAKKDALTGIDVIPPELIKKNKRGRPRKSDTITKAGPSRLREVMNAEDFDAHPQLPFSTPPAETVQTPTANRSDAILQRPVTPAPNRPSATSISSAGRNPVKKVYSSPTPPPRHSASFRDDLPAQPAPKSPPKASTVSPLRNVVDGTQQQHIKLFSVVPPPARNTQFRVSYPTQSIPSSTQASTMSTPRHTGGAQSASSQPYYMNGHQVTATQPYFIAPTDSLAVPVFSVSRAPSTILASPVSAPSGVQPAMTHISTPTAPPPTPKNSSTSGPASNVAPSDAQQPSTHGPTPSANPPPSTTTSVPSTLNPNVQQFVPQSTTTQTSKSTLSATPKPTFAPTPHFGVLIPGAQNPTGHAAAPANKKTPKKKVTPKLPSELATPSVLGPQTPIHKTPLSSQQLPHQAVSAVNAPNSQPAASLAAGQQNWVPRTPQVSHPTPPQLLPITSIPTSQPVAAFEPGPQPSQVLPTGLVPASQFADPPVTTLPRTPARGASETNRSSPPYVSPYKNTSSPLNVPNSFPANTTTLSAADVLENTSLANAILPPDKLALKSSSANGAGITPSKPAPKNSLANIAAPSPSQAKRKLSLINYAAPSPAKKGQNSSATVTDQPASQADQVFSPVKASIPSPKSTLKKKRTPANATPQPKVTPGKIRFNTKGAHPRTPIAQPHASMSMMSEAPVGKRPRDESDIVSYPEEQAAKKPRLEQQTQHKNSFMDEFKVVEKKMSDSVSNLLTGGKDAAVKSSPSIFSDIANDSTTGSSTLSAATAEVVSVNQPAAPLHSEPENTTVANEVTPSMVTPPRSVSLPRDIPMADNLTTPSQVNRLNTIEDAPPETPKTPTNAPSSTQDLPSKPRKQMNSKKEAAKAAGQALLQQAADQVREIANESKRLRAPPPILAEKTRSAARHARTNSQSSTESATDKQARNFIPEPATAEPPLQRRMSNIELQVPPLKRAAPESLTPSFQREGSLAKKLKTDDTSSSTTPANGATQAKKGAQKKGFNIKTTNKSAGQSKATPQTQQTPQYGEGSSFAAPAVNPEPVKTGNRKRAGAPAQFPSKPASQNGESILSTASPANLGPAKKIGNTKKATPAEAPATADATPGPKSAPKSKPHDQPKTTTLKAATKPKATVREFNNTYSESYTNS